MATKTAKTTAVPHPQHGGQKPGHEKGQRDSNIPPGHEQVGQALSWSGRLNPSVVTALQREVGNEATVRLLRRRGVQPNVNRNAAEVIQRVVGGDVTKTTITKQWAWDLNDVELQQQVNLVRTELQKNPAGAGHAAQQGNLEILENEARTRHSQGLRALKSTADFAKAAHDFWKDTANRARPMQAFSDFLIEKVNQMIPHPCASRISTSGSSGAFSRVTWSITVNTGDFSKRAGVTTVGDLNADEAGEIVDTIYHEGRHSEQYFLIAQKMAGQGKSATEIARTMSIPPEVAGHAVNSPLQTGTISGKRKAAEAEQWEQITVGKYGKYKGQVNVLGDEIDEVSGKFDGDADDVVIGNLDGPITDVDTHITDFFVPEETKIKRIASPDDLDKIVLQHIQEIKGAFLGLKKEYNRQKGDPTKYNTDKLEELTDKLNKAQYSAYRDFEHEKDAWATGAAAGAAFKNRK